MDAVDKIVAQWNRERPDLDVGPMGLLGRLAKVRSHVARELETEFARHGLNSSSFDVLATLRRAGAPYRLSPSDLMETMMITSGTMTNRIDQLEKAGMVERLDNPEDRRGVIIALTEKGFETVDKTVTDHVANQHRIVAPLDAYERQQLNTLLAKFLAAYE
jgi:DNA-binding MarR family transcriptional regulator